MWNEIIRQFLEKSIVKGLALLFAGVLAGGLLSLLIQKTVFDITAVILGVVVLVFFLILYGSGATSMMWNGYLLWKRRLTPKVGILNDMKWDLKNGEIYTWTDISPKEWGEEIKELARKRKVEIKVNLITSEENFDTYNAIINPYGGVYPESDIKTSKIQNKILNYVNEGGLFVNVSDIPGYYAYNALLERRIDTTPQIYGTLQTSDGKIIFIPARPFELTPLIKELGLRIYPVESNPSIFNWGVLEFEEGVEKTIGSKISGINVHRVVALEKNVDSIVKPKEVELQQGKMDVAPIFFVKYGLNLGKFLISLIFENFKDHTEKTRNELKRMLAKLIMDFIDP